MANKPDSKADDSAEKAYAAAAEAVSVKDESAPPVEEALVAFPPKASRNGKSVASAKVAAPEPVVQVSLPAKPAKPVKSAAKKAKAVVKKAEVKVKKAEVKKVVARKSTSAKVGAVAKPASEAAVQKATETRKILIIPTIAQLKDKIMATTKTPDFTAGIKDAIADVQAKAKEAFEKSTSAFGDVNEFTKGNVEALVESGKILASGLQELGTTVAAEGRSAYEILTADVKELSAVKSPADFFKLQGDIARRNFDTAVASGSKHSEALMKLASDVFAPISGRVSVAVDKVRKAA